MKTSNRPNPTPNPPGPPPDFQDQPGHPDPIPLPLQDLVAAAAIQGARANPAISHDLTEAGLTQEECFEWYARQAYRIAEAFIACRNLQGVSPAPTPPDQAADEPLPPPSAPAPQPDLTPLLPALQELAATWQQHSATAAEAARAAAQRARFSNAALLQAEAAALSRCSQQLSALLSGHSANASDLNGHTG